MFSVITKKPAHNRKSPEKEKQQKHNGWSTFTESSVGKEVANTRRALTKETHWTQYKCDAPIKNFTIRLKNFVFNHGELLQKHFKIFSDIFNSLVDERKIIHYPVWQRQSSPNFSIYVIFFCSKKILKEFMWDNIVQILLGTI